MTFFFIAILALHPHSYHPEDEEYPHFFKMPVLMLILITVLNDGTLISVAYDHVKPSHNPEKWNLKVPVGTVQPSTTAFCSSYLLACLLTYLVTYSYTQQLTRSSRCSVYARLVLAHKYLFTPCRP